MFLNAFITMIFLQFLLILTPNKDPDYLDILGRSFSDYFYQFLSIFGYFFHYSKIFLSSNKLAFIYASLKYESAFLIGLIEDFATVILFFIDAVFFNIPVTFCSLIGCGLVGFVVISISFQKQKK